MNTSKKPKTMDLIRSDFYRYTGKNGGVISVAKYFVRNHCSRYSFWLRIAGNTSRRNPLFYFAALMHRRVGSRHGLQIPFQATIGYGLYIGHGINMIVNPRTVIGNNVNLSQGLTIGSNRNTPAIIGDNVYIGPNVCIVENVRVGSDSTIGAGSVVVRDVPAGTTVAGNPARVINPQSHPEYVLHRYIPKD